MQGNNNTNEKKPKVEKTYRLSISQYRKKTRDEERLKKLKVVIAEASRITKQIK